ncbi:MAG TPA: hypothetical protein PK504_01435 [Ferruginibacter sp.]|nr:hypothetical protein [Ferruginibacter sp.]HRE64359.1 hypothetical protein [Ferruginibacter sp.]
MRKFIGNSFLFAVFTVIVYLLLIAAYGVMPKKMYKNINYATGAYGHMFSRMSEVKQTKDVDILFLGSSHSYRGFNPQYFSGYKTFNLGSSAQTPIQTNLLLKRYLHQLNPKTIVYEVYPISLSIDGVESSSDIIANDKNDFLSAEMATKINHITTYNTLLYGFYRDMFSLNKSFMEPKKIGFDTYVPGGYVERTVSFYKPKNNSLQRAYHIQANQLKAFEENMVLIKRSGIQLILVQAPVPSTVYNSYSNNDYYDSLMNSFSVPYYNFNKLLALNDSLHFYDSSHLNQIGVKIFNEKLLEKLQ